MWPDASLANPCIINEIYIILQVIWTNLSLASEICFDDKYNFFKGIGRLPYGHSYK